MPGERDVSRRTDEAQRRNQSPGSQSIDCVSFLRIKQHPLRRRPEQHCDHAIAARGWSPDLAVIAIDSHVQGR
jgi:hypothetical protein